MKRKPIKKIEMKENKLIAEFMGRIKTFDIVDDTGVVIGQALREECHNRTFLIPMGWPHTVS